MILLISYYQMSVFYKLQDTFNKGTLSVIMDYLITESAGVKDIDELFNNILRYMYDLRWHSQSEGTPDELYKNILHQHVDKELAHIVRGYVNNADKLLYQNIIYEDLFREYPVPLELLIRKLLSHYFFIMKTPYSLRIQIDPKVVIDDLRTSNVY
jgi:hypothetical protein